LHILFIFYIFIEGSKTDLLYFFNSLKHRPLLFSRPKLVCSYEIVSFSLQTVQTSATKIWGLKEIPYWCWYW